MGNSSTVLLFEYLILIGLIKKSANYVRGIYDCPNDYTIWYDDRLSKPGLVNIYIRKM